MRKNLLLFILFLISFSVLGQDWQWVKEAGGTHFSESKSIVTDANGNSYVTGSFATSITIGTITLSGSANGSTFVVRYDSNGSLVWAKAISGTSVVESMDIAADANGNTLITGNFKGIATMGAFTLTSPDDRSAFIAKLDQDGNVLWAKAVGSSDGDVKGTNITTDVNGSAYVTGNFFKSLRFGSATFTATKDEQLFIAKYSSTGELSWVKLAGGLGSCFTHDISTDNSGNLYLAGQFWLTTVFGTTTLSNYSDVTKPADIFIAKYDAKGNALWAKQAGGTEGDDVATGITVDADGNSYITGFYQNRATFETTTITGNAAGNIFLAKYTAAGSLQWVRKQEGTSDARGVSIDRDSNGNLYIAGHFEGSITSGSATLVSYGGYDMFFARYDATGNVTGAMQAGGDGTDLVKKLQVSPGGGIYFTGNYDKPVTFGVATLTAGIVVGKLNAINYDPEPAPTITTGPLSSSVLCHGSTIEVPFSTTGRFGKDNVFTVQLSNNSGTFTYPVNLGSGTTSPIIITIPTDYATGTGYKIRVVASSPGVIGTNSSTSLTLSKPPVVTASVASKTIIPGASTNLSASGADSYVWSPATGLNNAHVANPVATPQTTTAYTVTGTKNGCTSTAIVTVRVEPAPPAGSAFTWASVKYGGATSHTEAMTTATDAAGNVYVAGHFSDEITFGSTTLAVPGYTGYDQIFIVKYNAAGQVLWAKEVGGEQHDRIQDMALDKQGNLYLTGWFDPAITIGSKTLIGEENGINYFVAKFDANGNPLWANQIKGPNNEVMALTTGLNGEVYVAGTFGETATFNELSLESSPLKDYFLVKYNSNGDVAWAESISGTSVKGYSPMDLATDSGGNIYATGCFNEGTLVFGSTTLSSSIEYTNSFFAKYNPQGQVQWTKFIGQNEIDLGHTTSNFIAVDKNDKIYLVGASNSRTRFDDVSFGSAGVSGTFLAQFDVQGRMLWVTDPGNASMRGLTTDAEGFIYITGVFNSGATFGTRRFAIGNAEYAAFVTKYDALGNVVWAEQATAKRYWDVMSNGISVDNRQNIYMVGTFDNSGAHEPVVFGCHTIKEEVSGPGHYYVAKLSPIDGPPPAIATGKLAGEALCAGSVIEVPFTATGNGAGCASYTVLLSDAKGSFASAQIIGTGSNTGNSLTATIPANTAAGNGYRIKVIGSAPAITGTDNGTDLSIAALPVVQISASAASPCPGATGITYTASSASQLTSFAWAVPDGWVITEGQGTNKIKVTAGTKAGEVTLAVRGSCGPEVVKSMSVASANVFAPTVWNTSSTICGRNNAVFTASGAPYDAKYRWYASETATEPIWEDRPSGSESRFYTPVVSVTTNYYVSIRFSSGCESERVKLTLNVTTPPSIPEAVTASVAKPCAGASVVYQVSAVTGASGYEWAVPFGWTIISGQGSSQITVMAGSTAGQVSVAAYNFCGTSPARFLAAEVGAPVAPTVASGSKCGEGQVTLNALEPKGVTFNWYTSATGGTPIATGATFTTPHLTTSTTYYVSAVSAAGCESARTSATAIISSAPTVSAGQDITMCITDRGIGLTGASPAGGTWSGLGVTARGVFDPAVAGSGVHEVTYTYTDQAGCLASDTRIIAVLEAPTVTLADFSTLCNTVQGYVLTGGQPAGGVYSGVGVVNGLFTPVDTIGNYNITYTYTNARGCAVSVTKPLKVSNCTGVPKSKLAARLQVYPNPTEADVQVELPLPAATALTLRLFDAKGLKLYEQNYPRLQGEFKQVISLKNQPKGIYLLQLLLDDGVITKRVVRN